MTDPSREDRNGSTAESKAESVSQHIGSAGRDAMQVGRDYVSHSQNKTKISVFITALLVLGGMAAAFGINKIREVTSSPKPDASQPALIEKK